MNYLYYKVIKSRTEHKGVRLFRTTGMFDEVTEVCMSTGEAKRGHGNYVGVFTISRQSFLSNYLAMGYLQPCTKSVYEKAFNLIFNYLRSSKYKKV